jgi:adenylate cyclase
MDKISKAFAWGLITGLAGLLIGTMIHKVALEEKIGLHLLFKVRGERQAPSDVIVVSIDRISADTLNLSHKPDRWPRDLHGRLVKNLAEEGAGVIAFDIFFHEPRDTEGDMILADSIDKSGNVVLVGVISRDKLPVRDEAGIVTGDINIEKVVQPAPPFRMASAAVAPFPLPKMPVRVSQYWTFKPGAGSVPTLPIASFQVFTLDVYDELIQLLKKHYVVSSDDMLQGKTELISRKGIVKEMQKVRDIFQRDPLVAEKMLEDAGNPEIPSLDTRKAQKIRALIRMYQSRGSRYINFYGPPRTIRTISYYEALNMLEERDDRPGAFDFRNKAVFIGSSESFQPYQVDGFTTVFTQRDGLDISGVEIAATAFANLLEDKHVTPVPLLYHVLILLFWGIITGICCRLFSNILALAAVTGMTALYFIIALSQFSESGIWYPLVVPLFFQVPLAYFGAVVWKYTDLNKERQTVRKAFSYYLPEDVVNRITRNISDLDRGSEVVYGTCLYTDAGQYTSLSEEMAPEELNSLLNRYYESIFTPVGRYGGVVSNIIGDAMLALWVTKQNDAGARKNACLAALEIKNVVNGSRSDTHLLPTRIGLHSGPISLGNLGAAGHYEYRPVGDIVNTTTRIDELNKYLGTKILVSEEILKQLEGFVTRELGKFLVKGKKRPLLIHELVCLEDECSREDRDRYAYFRDAYEAFRKGSWTEASINFHNILQKYGEDGPSERYLMLCKSFMKSPPEEAWDGLIRIDRREVSRT